MRWPSSITLISVGLASMTVSVILAAQSIGITQDDEPALLRARMQAVQLLVIQCVPAARAGDNPTLASLVAGMASTNSDVVTARLYDARGETLYQFNADGAAGAATAQALPDGLSVIRLPITDPFTQHVLGEVGFGYRQGFAFSSHYLPDFLDRLVRNPSLRLAAFVSIVGFAAYRLYLRRMLRALDPSSVIPPRVRTMLDALAEGVLVLDRRGVIVMANESFGRTTGLPLSRIQGNRVDKMAWVDPFGTARPKALPWAGMLSSGQAVIGAHLGLDSHGPTDADAHPDAHAGTVPARRRLYMVNTAPIVSPDGKVRGGLVTFDDVTEIERINLELQESRDEIQRQNVELQRLATTDPLTGCLNRRSFLEQFERHWKAVAETGSPLGCVMVDVDRFKSVNDRFGHAAGDSVLVDVSRLLRESTAARGAGAIVCRYGGEEFCVLLPDTSLAASAAFAEAMRQTIDGFAWTVTPVTASLGVSSSEQGAAQVKELLDWADRSLYHSKKTGRNRVTCWGAMTEPKIDARSAA